MKLKSEFGSRLKRVMSDMKNSGISAIFVSNPRNILYLTGRETGRAIITKNNAILWLKDLYRDLHEDFYKNVPFEIRAHDESAVGEFVRRLRVKKIGVEEVSVSRYDKLRRSFRKKLIVNDVVGVTRAVKSGYEIEMVKKSALIAKKGMRKAYDIIREGVRESDAVSEIEYTIRRAGSEKPPFENGMLLASGRRSADIHAYPQSNKISRGLAVVDLGACWQHYHSDMTRTIKVGKVDKFEKEMSEFIENLRQEAIDKVRVGQKASKLHEFVENAIEKKGYRFYHGTGHGIGLNVHERPNVAKGSEDVLKAGMVFTIEPGIYIPRKFGVRFEDTILLKRSGVEILTR